MYRNPIHRICIQVAGCLEIKFCKRHNKRILLLAKLSLLGTVAPSL
jgi:hypothetical protein